MRWRPPASACPTFLFQRRQTIATASGRKAIAVRSTRPFTYRRAQVTRQDSACEGGRHNEPERPTIFSCSRKRHGDSAFSPCDGPPLQLPLHPPFAQTSNNLREDRFLHGARVGGKPCRSTRAAKNSAMRNVSVESSVSGRPSCQCFLTAKSVLAQESDPPAAS